MLFGMVCCFLSVVNVLIEASLQEKVDKKAERPGELEWRRSYGHDEDIGIWSVR